MNNFLSVLVGFGRFVSYVLFISLGLFFIVKVVKVVCFFIQWAWFF